MDDEGKAALNDVLSGARVMADTMQRARNYVSKLEAGQGDGWNDDMSAAPLGELREVSFTRNDGEVAIGKAKRSGADWLCMGIKIAVYAHRPLRSTSPAPLPEHREASDHE